jgi:hypothetical protein
MTPGQIVSLLAGLGAGIFVWLFTEWLIVQAGKWDDDQG